MNTSLFLENNISQFIIRYNEGQVQKSSRKGNPKPVSLSSEINLPSRNKRKIRLNSSQISPLEKCDRRSPASHSLHTNPDQRKEDREYSRVPIEYMEERDSGNAADRIRGRVVYRGYAPKNTYFYFKTIKELRFSQFSSRGDRDYRGQDINFNSKFESGNLNAAVRVGSREYWLFMREDTNTHGLRQWFFFQARSRKSIKIRFRIYRFSKKFSLYKLGMKPFVRTIQSQWRQDGENVVYQYDSQQKCHYLEFEYLFQEHKEVYFASLPPYTYSMVTSFLQNIATDPRVAVKKVGLSLGGLDIYSVKISGKKSLPEQENLMTERSTKKAQNLRESQNNKSPSKKPEKEAIIVLARTHPGQTVSNWSLESFIERILQKEQLTQRFNFYILPMVNPDGVFLGNHRTGVLGQDLNRNFNLCDLQYFPEIQIVDAYISGILKKHKVAFMFDLHGHSAKKNIFAFGQECQSGSKRYLFSRIIPKILADTIDSFKLQLCLFKASKEKTNTARVYFSKRYNLNAITFQQSYGLLQTGCIGIKNWRNFGTALADSLLTYAELTKDKKDQSIFYYLSDYMDAQKEENSQKILREQEKQRRKKEKELQKQKQKEAEEAKQRIFISKTEETERITVRYSKLFEKSTRNAQLVEQKSQIQKMQIQQNQNQSLSSGDEQLQMKQNELQLIKKDIFRVGVINKQIAKRQLYSMAQKKMELGYQYADYPGRLHQKNSSMVQRIFKFKSKQRVRQMELPYSVSQRQKGASNIELPQIRK